MSSHTFEDSMVIGWQVHSITLGKPVKTSVVVQIIDGLSQILPTLPRKDKHAFVGKGEWVEDGVRPLFFVYIGEPNELVISDDEARICRAWDHAAEAANLDTSKPLNREMHLP